MASAITSLPVPVPVDQHCGVSRGHVRTIASTRRRAALLPIMRGKQSLKRVEHKGSSDVFAGPLTLLPCFIRLPWQRSARNFPANDHLSKIPMCGADHAQIRVNRSRTAETRRSKRSLSLGRAGPLRAYRRQTPECRIPRHSAIVWPGSCCHRSSRPLMVLGGRAVSPLGLAN